MSKKEMTKRDFSVLFALFLFFAFCFWCYKVSAWDYAIRDKLADLKQRGLIIDYDDFNWEYDYKNIASFDIKFCNGKTGNFNYAKLVDGKIVFETMSDYDGYVIYGYKIQKQTNKVYLQVGLGNFFNMTSVEDVVENLSDIDKIIEEMPVINMDSSADIYKEDFLQKLPDKVRYEDDEVEVIFYRVRSSN